jgi:riboflavin biosynthesis pyrimidine reductase
VIRQIFPDARPLGSDTDLEAIYDTGPRPWVRADFAASLDGAVEVDGRSRKLGGPADRAAFLAMRAVCDVILVGAGTVRAENYGPVRLAPEVEERRVARGQSRLPRLAVVTARGDIPPTLPIFASAERPIVITTSSALGRDASLATRAQVLEYGAGAVDVGAAVEGLRGMGLVRILSEGGPSLLRTLLAGDLVDELCLTISPLLAGAGPLRLTGDEPLASPLAFRLESVLEGDGLLLTRYRRGT